ncbi:MAG: hypothetical protein Q8S18_14575, partial [Bacteroidales bacterium]|nr:hypothetical protein [Bacteroidales bacterium]
WYPGAEPGGGGYIAQRMLAAKNEKNAMGATMLFNFFHYAVRPWPWIIVGLLSLIVFPDLASLQQAFPDLDPQYVQHDLAYPAMLRLLPHGFLGLVVASLIAAFMSTTASQLNWGSSYIVNDFYVRFINPDASQKQQVIAGRITTAALMVMALLFALVLENALQAFHILLQIGAGTGMIYILRWFWWRINAFTELTGMIVSFVVAVGFVLLKKFYGYDPGETFKILSGVGITTVAWLLATFLSKPANDETLRSFYMRIRPGGFGWKKVVDKARAAGIEIQKKEDLAWDVPTGILCMLLGTVSIYSILFAIGEGLYGNLKIMGVLIVVALISLFVLSRTWKKLRMN